MGESNKEILSSRYCPVPGIRDENSLEEEIDKINGGSFKHKEPPEIRGSGYVAQEDRKEADYGFFTESGEEESKTIIFAAVNFLEEYENFLSG